MGWNKPTGAAPAAPKKKPNAFRGLIAGFLVVALAAIAYFAFLSDNASVPKAKAEKKPAAIKVVTPAAAPKAVVEEPKEVSKADENRELVARLKTMTPEERLQYFFEEAKKKPINLTPATNRAFATGTEQVMSWIFTTKLGDPPPPLPRLSIRDEAHLAEILISNNPVLETDSERTAAAKMAVEEAKKEAMKFVKEGGDVHEFLQYYRDQLAQAHHEFTDARKSVLDMIRSGEDPELCDTYIQKVNEKLAERGIQKRVEIPPEIRERLSTISEKRMKGQK